MAKRKEESKPDLAEQMESENVADLVQWPIVTMGTGDPTILGFITMDKAKIPEGKDFGFRPGADEDGNIVMFGLQIQDK